MLSKEYRERLQEAWEVFDSMVISKDTGIHLIIKVIVEILEEHMEPEDDQDN